MFKKSITTNETNPIQEKHTILERLFNQKYILESQGLLFDRSYELTQYSLPQQTHDDAWSSILMSLQAVGARADDAARALSHFAEVYRNGTDKR